MGFGGSQICSTLRHIFPFGFYGFVFILTFMLVVVVVLSEA